MFGRHRRPDVDETLLQPPTPVPAMRCRGCDGIQFTDATTFDDTHLQHMCTSCGLTIVGDPIGDS